MSYLDFIEESFKISQLHNSPIAIDLFSGCGGLALGFEAAGFKTIGYEMDSDACKTYRENLKEKCFEIFIDKNTEISESVDVIIGGPPCQPFSVNGSQIGKLDVRDGFPAFLSAVERYNPKIVVIENVRGMLFRNKPYFEHIINNLRNLDYIVEYKILNSVDFGVPQKRERLFIVAHRGKWIFPNPIKYRYNAGDALEGLINKIPKNPKFLTKNMDRYIEIYEKKSKCIHPRDLHLDKPSRTVTCRNLAGATSDMLRIRLPDGRRRRLSYREGARLQSFPDWFKFYGNEESKFNQIGNAVPPLLSKAIAKSVKTYLDNGIEYSIEEIRRLNKRKKPKQVTLPNQVVPMDKKEKKKKEALEIIEKLEIKIDDLTQRKKERMALGLLAVSNIKPESKWKDAKCWDGKGSWALSTREIIKFWNEYYGEKVSSGSYDDVRRKDLIRLVLASIVIKSAGKPKAKWNDPTRKYAISKDAIEVLKKYGEADWKGEVKKFVKLKGSLKEKMDNERKMNKIPVKLPNKHKIFLEQGIHNELQKAIIEIFLPSFAPGSNVLYVGDANDKTLYRDDKALEKLGFFDLSHGRLPDVVAYYDEKKWIFLIEAVHSSNPISKERHLELMGLTKKCKAPRIYVSVFNDRHAFKKFINELSWETEVWIVDSPTHMIHFNGEKFLGAYNTK